MLKKEVKIGEKSIFIGMAILLLFPSIYYLINGNGIFHLISNFNFFYLPNGAKITIQKVISGGLFFLVMITLFVIYLKIIKKERQLFQTNKQIAGFIVGVSILFACVLPMASTDLFYYMGTGWSEAKYKVNPYYTSVEQVIHSSNEASQDEILLKTPKVWRNDTIVYGPMWPILCKILSGLSCGSLTVAFIIYKVFNLMIHLVNAYIIYKITQKRKWVLLYALNPLVLFAGLVEGHNDILVVGLILLALYFFKKRKNMMMSVILLAIATTVKYYAILLIPFLVIYYYRNEKVQKRILYASGWAILFIGILASVYLVYTKDITVFAGIQKQQGKFANTFFVSLAMSNYKEAVKISKIIMGSYIIIYIVTILKLLFSKKISFTKNMRIYSNLLLLFIFVTITNFQAWYVMWLFSTIMWQRGKMVRFLLNVGIAVELANVIYFLLNESIIYAKYYSLALIGAIIILEVINNRKEGKNAKTREAR